MSNQNNVVIVQQAYADFGKGNIQGILDICTDDILWASYENTSVPYAGIFNGKEGVKKFFGSLAESIDYSNFEPREFISEGGSVAVRGHHTGTVKKTGKNFDHDWCMIFKFRSGKVYDYFVFIDTRDQAEAFGLLSPEG